MGNLSIPRGSVEHIHARVVADETLTDAVSVHIAVGRDPDTFAYTWLTAAWTGTEAATRTAVTSTPVTFSVANYPAGSYTVYVKVTDSPEAAVIKAGTLAIV